MKKLNIAVCGLMFAAATATLVSCQDIVTYNDGYDDGIQKVMEVYLSGRGIVKEAPDTRYKMCRGFLNL